MTMIIDQCPAGWNVIVDAKWLRVLAAASPPTEGVKLPKGKEAVRYRTDLFRPFSGQSSFPPLGLSSFGFGTRLIFFLSSLQVFWVLDRDTRRLLVNTGSCLHGNFDSSFNYRHSVEWGRGLICWNNTSRWIGWLEFVIKVIKLGCRLLDFKWIVFSRPGLSMQVKLQMNLVDLTVKVIDYNSNCCDWRYKGPICFKAAVSGCTEKC